MLFGVFKYRYTRFLSFDSEWEVGVRLHAPPALLRGKWMRQGGLQNLSAHFGASCLCREWSTVSELSNHLSGHCSDWVFSLSSTKPKELEILSDGHCRRRKSTQKPEDVTKVTVTLFRKYLRVIWARFGSVYGSRVSMAEVSCHNCTDITVTILQNCVESMYYPIYALHSKHTWHT